MTKPFFLYLDSVAIGATIIITVSMVAAWILGAI